MTSMASRGQPSAAARSTRAYWRRVDSPCSITCAAVDCRMYTTALRARFDPVILPLIADLALRSGLRDEPSVHQLAPPREQARDVRCAGRRSTAVFADLLDR